MKHPQSPAPERTGRSRTAILALSMLLASLGTSIANIALPTLAAAFAVPFDVVQWVVVAYLAALTVTAIVAGKLGDAFGLKRMLLVGLAVFAAASLMCALASNLWLLIGARALQGFGAAFLMTLTMALMRETVDDKSIGRAMGLLGTMSALGTALGPSLGGALILAAGWRGIFLVQIPLALLTLILASASLPGASGNKKEAPAISRPMLDANLVSNLIVNLLVAAVMMTTLVVGPFYLGLAARLPEAMIGLVMSVGPVISIFGGVPAGRAIDVWGSSRILFVGLAMLTVGALLLATLPQIVGVAGYIAAVAVLTPGYQLFQAANNTAALANVPQSKRGVVSGMLSLSRNVGLIVGASALGAVFAFGAGATDVVHASPSAIATGMRLTFLIAAGMMALALIVAMRTSIANAGRRERESLSKG